MIGRDDIAKLTQFAELAGIAPDPTTILDIAAVGLVEQVWRNSPLEDMHASRRGPSDGEMFAESVALQRVARGVLANGTNVALLDFERHVLIGNGRGLPEAARCRRWATGTWPHSRSTSKRRSTS